MQIDLQQLGAVLAILATVIGSTVKITSRLNRLEAQLGIITARCDERHNGPARRRTMDLQEQTT